MQDPVPLPLSFIFPINEFPEIVRDAVIEVHRNVQAPMALIASSALGAMSLSCQHAVDVQRPNCAVSPVSLFLMVIAESGERKTSVDRQFTEPIHKYQENKDTEAKAKQHEYKAEYTIWKGIFDHINDNIKKAIKAGNSEQLPTLKGVLSEHLKLEPGKVRTVKLIYQNATPEALLHGLSQCPSAGIMSNEGGNVLNGRVMGDLSMLNSAWDGSIQSVDRKTSESIYLNNVRLTISNMLQKVAFDKFINSKGDEARGIGFFARLLICYPESTQGSRYFEQGSSTSVALTKFQDRITEILNAYPIDVDSFSKRTVLEFSPDATRIWINAFNTTENMLKNGYWLCEVKDFGSKVGENLARLAALLHFFEGKEGPISGEEMRSSWEIMQWFIYEFKRLFSSTPPIPQYQSDAMELENWMRKRFLEYGNCFPKNELLQRCPNKLRNKARLEAAIECLKFYGIIITKFNNKQKVVELNMNYVYPQHQSNQPNPLEDAIIKSNHFWTGSLVP